MLSLRTLTGHPNDPTFDNELFGLEIEAEGLGPEHIVQWREQETERPKFEHRLLNNLVRTGWRFITDGSLRTGGVEFVSDPVSWFQAEDLLALAGQVVEAGVVRPSVRTGMHVHVNTRHWSFDDFRKFVASYTMVEPLLFQCVGQARAQSIYCVPWMDGKNEPEVVAQAIADTEAHMGMFRQRLRQSCKYSALFCGPLLSYGTVEFRHAPTWNRAQDFVSWFRVVRDVSHMRMDIGTADTIQEWLRSAIGDRWHGFALDWDEYAKTVEKYGLVKTARSFLPCTYKVKKWGIPAGRNIPAAPPPETRTRAQMVDELVAAPNPDAWQTLAFNTPNFDLRNVVLTTEDDHDDDEEFGHAEPADDYHDDYDGEEE